MENQPNTLDGLLGTQEAADTATTDQLLDLVTTTLEGLEGSLGSLHVTIRTLNGRIATLENFVAYLLSKNPDTAEKFKELSAQAAAAESNANGQILSQMPAQV